MWGERRWACAGTMRLMRILLTNDDGVRAPGIRAMYEALIDADGDLGGALAETVLVCAPLTVQSATSHGITFDQPLMTSEFIVDDAMPVLAVDGRPADCVKLALSNLWPERFGEGSRPDLVISGMNAGANVGINVIYSGTVAAALEAAFLGVPSIAVSLHLGRGKPRFDVAAKHARQAIDRILESCGEQRQSFESHTCLNVGVPQTEEAGPLPEIRVCPMNRHGHEDAYEQRVSPGGDVYYWSSGDGLGFRGFDEGADVDLMWKQCITVTPLEYDLTNQSQLELWKGRVEGQRTGG